MKHFLGRIWNPVFTVIDLKKATIKIKDGSTGSLVSVAGGGDVWTDSTAKPGEHYSTETGVITSKPVVVQLLGTDITANEGILGSLVAYEWAWGDNDTIGGDRLYVRLPASADPDDLVADALKVALTQTANEIEVKIGEGNLSYTRAKTIEYILDRGNLDDVREGDEVPLDISMDFQWDYISGLAASGIPTIEEALNKEGEASDWTSVDSDACRPYAVDLEITYLPTPSTCGDQEIITLPEFRYESLDHDLRAGTIAVSGKCNKVKPTAVRSAQ